MLKKFSGISVKPRRVLSSAIALLILSPPVTAVRPVWAAPVDAGAQLNQAREYMERQRVAQELEEGQEKRKAKVETEAEKPDKSAEKVTFVLEKVQVEKSEILKEDEVSAITAKYEGKTVSLQDLYQMTSEINDLYEKKGYAVCRAYLPPQRIHKGVVQLRLLEGKTGKVTINGLRHTRKGYVAHRIPLEPGVIANTDTLNEQLQRFNATNDVQLRILVHAGEKPGTTDYEIAAFEPAHNQVVTLYVDNHGYETSGRWREGIFYTVRSLTGQRDALHLNYLHSRGTDIFGANYSMPVNNLGTMLDFDYGTNRTKTVKGVFADIGLKGHAYAASLTLRHPLKVTRALREEVGLQYLHQSSQTDLGTNTGTYIKWVDDVRNTYVPFISFTHYGNSSVIYHKHSFPFTNFNGRLNDNYFAYRLDALYQKRYGSGQMLSARFNAQFASERKNMSSSDMFYIGGSNSVRGYEESFLRANQGYTASVTYLAPLDKKRIFSAFGFLDYGRVFGDETTTVDHTLVSTGLGLTANYKNFSSSLTLGIPLRRKFNSQTEKVNKTRIDFACSYTF